MDLITMIGVIASTFTSLALVPQLIKLIREKEGSGTSIGMMLVLMIVLILWIMYGVLKEI